jgi:hypothetical protein
MTIAAVNAHLARQLHQLDPSLFEEVAEVPRRVLLGLVA